MITPSFFGQSYTQTIESEVEEEAMINNDQKTSDDDIPAISHIDIDIDILPDWRAGKSVSDIAKEKGLDIKTVMRTLKHQQKKEQKKSILQKGS